MAVSTCITGNPGKSLIDRLLKAPMVSLEHPDLFSGVYESASEEIALHVGQQRMLATASQNPVEFMQQSYTQAAKSPGVKGSAGGGRQPNQPDSKKPRAQPGKSNKQLQRQLQGLFKQQAAVLAKLGVKGGPQAGGAPPPRGGASSQGGGGGGSDGLPFPGGHS